MGYPVQCKDLNLNTWIFLDFVKINKVIENKLPTQVY